MGINSAEAWDEYIAEHLQKIGDTNMTTKTKHSGTHAIVVTCTSPRGVRKVQYLYHYDGRNDRLPSDEAHIRAAMRRVLYEDQGWTVIQRRVDLRTLRKGQRP